MESDSIFNTLQAQYPFLSEYKYLLLFIAGSLEGFSAMILAGFLLSVGRLSFGLTYLTLSLAEVVNGYLWYSVGYWGGWRPVDWFVAHSKRQRRVVGQVRRYLEQYTAQAILLAKMTFGVTVLTQMLAGAIRYPFRKFTLYNFIGSFLWVAVLLAIGYFFGEGYKALYRYWQSLKHLAAYGLGALVILYLLRTFFRVLLFRLIAWADKIQKFGKKIGEGMDKIVSGEDQD